MEIGSPTFSYIITGVASLGIMVVVVTALLLRQPRTGRTAGKPAEHSRAGRFAGASSDDAGREKGSAARAGAGAKKTSRKRKGLSLLLRRIRPRSLSGGASSRRSASAGRAAAADEHPSWKRKRDLVRAIRARRTGKSAGMPGSPDEETPAPGPLPVQDRAVSPAAPPSAPPRDAVPESSASPLSSSSGARASRPTLDVSAELQEIVRKWALSMEQSQGIRATENPGQDRERPAVTDAQTERVSPVDEPGTDGPPVPTEAETEEARPAAAPERLASETTRGEAGPEMATPGDTSASGAETEAPPEQAPVPEDAGLENLAQESGGAPAHADSQDSPQVEIDGDAALAEASQPEKDVEALLAEARSLVNDLQ